MTFDIKIMKRIAKLLSVCLLVTLASVNVYAASASDITGHWAKDTIQNWIEKGIIKGYEDGTFRPEDRITRAEFMSLVNGIFEYTESGSILFTDVDGKAWYAEAVSKAAAAGYITGYPDGAIKADSPITREEVASILMKINQLESNEAAAGIFTDMVSMGWSKGAIGAVCSAGIMTGYPDGSFGVRNNIKRAEALTALGDTIAFGSEGADGFGYVDLFTNKLMIEAGDSPFTANNFGKPGKNSSRLLNDLRTDQLIIEAVSKADVITISIGGNNLLKPVIANIERTFNLDSKSETFNNELTLLLAAKANRDKLKTVLGGISPELEAGVQQFKEDWPEIIKTVKAVKALSPDAKIYVMTIYNPILEGDAYYNTFDNPIKEINGVISAQSSLYEIADVYNAFNNYTGAEALTNFNLLKGSFDVHPTIKGYETIYMCHIS